MVNQATRVVKMRPDQFDLMQRIFSIPPDAREQLARVLSKTNSLQGLGDYENWLTQQQVPAEGFIKPYGPAITPIRTNVQKTDNQLLKDIHEELVRQRTPTRPLIRAKNIDQAGETLDWTANGQMGRLMIRNKGSNSTWMAFDQKGPSVDAFTSNNSVEIQANESWNIELCQFSFLGLKCSAGNTGTVHAIAFPSNSGSMTGSVS